MAPKLDVLHLLNRDSRPCLPQTQSPLFSVLPGEIRDRIFYFALSDYEDKAKPYEQETCYRRPGNFAPRRTDTALLCTCQRIYREAWFLPWTQAVHTLYLTSEDRRPAHITDPRQLQRTLNRIHRIHGVVEVDHVRVFAQLFALEPGHSLQQILDLRQFHPVDFSIVLRHTDWWYWERDEPLHVASDFVNRCRFPNSLRELRMELESVERRKDQIDYLAKEMTEKWQFQRKDGVRLSAQGQPKSVVRWSGSSTWNEERWIRDEVRPGILDFYTVTLSFKPVKAQEADDGGTIIKAPSLRVNDKRAMEVPIPSVSTGEMRAAGVRPGHSAEKVLHRIWELRDGMGNFQVATSDTE